MPAAESASGPIAVLVDGRPVRLYEVYWADLLMGENTAGAFQLGEFLSLAWYPLLNLLRGNYRKGGWSLLQLVWGCTSTWAMFSAT